MTIVMSQAGIDRHLQGDGQFLELDGQLLELDRRQLLEQLFVIICTIREGLL